MSLGTAARRGRVVEHRGRRFLVRPPTFRTVILGLGDFGKELTAFAKIADARPDLLSSGDEIRRGILDGLLGASGLESAGELLETCVSIIGGDAGEVIWLVMHDRDLALTLAVAVLSLCDVPRLFSGSGLEAASKTPLETLEGGERSEPSDSRTERQIVILAQRFGCSPDAVLDWSFESILMVNDAEDVVPREAGREATLDDAVGPLQQLSALGIGGYYREN